MGFYLERFVEGRKTLETDQFIIGLLYLFDRFLQNLLHIIFRTIEYPSQQLLPKMIQTIIISILFLHANQFSTIRILIMNRMERNNIQITKKALPL